MNTGKLYTLAFGLCIALLGMTSAQAQSAKKKAADTPAYMNNNSRASAQSSARKTADPFGFLKGSDQHKKNKDCGCPGTKKGERQRRKEFRSHRKRK